MKLLMILGILSLYIFSFVGCQNQSSQNRSLQSLPELKVTAASFENNGFTLRDTPDDNQEILLLKGHLQLELDILSQNTPLNEPLSISAQLDANELGVFDLYTTSYIRQRDPKQFDLHRNIKEDGSIHERIKGKVRTITPTCKSVNNKESCYVINKNSYRHFTLDLHLNEAAHEALLLNDDDINGSVIVSLSTSSLGTMTYRIPVAYVKTISTNSDIAVMSSTNSSFAEKPITRSSTSSNINESYSTNSGDSEYFSHTTSNTATTTTDSTGLVTYNQSLSVQVNLDKPSSNVNSPRKDSIHNESTYNLATMSTSVKAGQSEDVQNTNYGVKVDANNGTIWNITQNASTSSVNNPQTTANANSINLTSKTDTYNPQNEIVWNYCADEGQTCNLLQFSAIKGTAQVRFGADGYGWSYGIATDTVGCNTNNFGDPAHGIHKVCQYMVPPSYAPTWTRVAKEGESFFVNEKENMRFGHERDWNYFAVNGNYNCNTSIFGDPAHGTGKWCEIMTDEGAAPLNYKYTHCAEEGQWCSFQGSAVVRYGYAYPDGALFYVYNIARDGVQCSNAISGDPLHNVSKSCDYLQYIDPNSRQNNTDKIWSTNNAPSGTQDVASYEQVMAEVEFSKEYNMRWFWGVEFTAKMTLSGEAGVQANAYLDLDNRTFTLIGGPEAHISAEASGSGSIGDEYLTGKFEVGISAPISVLDIYSPYTVAFTVKPGVLSAEVSLDYFIDVMAGDVVLFMDYTYWIPGANYSDDMTLYSWNPIYQDSGTLYTGSLNWNVNLVKDYILPAIPDGYFKNKIGFDQAIEGRDYFLYVGGSLMDSVNGDYANEYTTIKTLCGTAQTIGQIFTFTGYINQEIPLSKGCSLIEISGIRAPSWPSGNGLSIGVREK